MDCISVIHEALELIEEELGNSKLNCEMIAKKINISISHLNRSFYVLVGVSIAEYVRNRRMSIAGIILSQKNCSVLDISLDLGYESPEAFSKAFKRFHGVSPSNCRNKNLRDFYPLQVNLIVSHKKPLNVKIAVQEAFLLSGNMECVMADDTNAISSLWGFCQCTEYLNKLCEHPLFLNVVGVYHNDRYTISGKYRCYAENKNVIKKHKWAIFKCDGVMPQAINQTWGLIYSSWMIENTIVNWNYPQLEVYSQSGHGYDCEIWIAVK